MNGQIRMRPKHVHGGRKEFVSMKRIIQVTTLNLCPAKNQVPWVLISRMILNKYFICDLLINHSKFLIFLEYDFKKYNHNTICIPREDKVFSSLEDAKKECQNNATCKGVLHANDTSPANYYLCKNTAKLVTNLYFDEKNSFYHKYVIGKKTFCL